jgi:hypothetical protein
MACTRPSAATRNQMVLLLPVCACLLVLLLVPALCAHEMIGEVSQSGAVVKTAAAPLMQDDANPAAVTAICRLVIHDHSTSNVTQSTGQRPDDSLLSPEALNTSLSTEVSLSCKPPGVVSVAVPKDSWLAAYASNFSGVNLVGPEDCPWRNEYETDHVTEAGPWNPYIHTDGRCDVSQWG